MKKLFLLSTVVLLLQACVSLKSPDVTYKFFRVTNLDLKQIYTEFHFDIFNPNSVGIESLNYDYELFVEGHKFAGAEDVTLHLTPLTTSDMVVPLNVVYQDLFDQANDIVSKIQKGQKFLPFTLKIRFELDFKIIKFTIPVTIEDQFPLPSLKDVEKQLPSGNLQEELKKIDLSKFLNF